MLKHSLPALRRFVDFLVVVDGAYKKFPLYNDNPESTDGSLAIAQEYADLIIFARRDQVSKETIPWQDEIQKRCAYLKTGYSDDYFFICDADEIPVGTLDRHELLKQDDWMVMLSRVNDHVKPYPIHRLFRHRPGIRYHGTHHAIHIGTKLIHPNSVKKNIFPGLRLDHLHMLRDKDRVEKKGEYYRSLQVDEAAFRSKEGL